MIAVESMAASVIGAAVAAGVILIAMQRRDWCVGVLAVLMIASGVLLYLTLFPPRLAVAGETLVVATADVPADLEPGPGERLVALPEAPPMAAAERVPDLASALRRHRQVERIRIEGRGLTRRDREIDVGLSAAFSPMKLPEGVTALEPPADVPAGSVFILAGEVTGLDGARAQLLDPAGRIVDRREMGVGGSFTLGGTVRSPGLALFTVRLVGPDGETWSDTPVPVRTLSERPVRALLIATPSPEVKYLRRWAEDAGIELTSSLDAGGGVAVGDGRVRIDRATLGDFDVVIVDDRSLQSLESGARAALARAIAGGLGVVVRMDGPANAGSRGGWRALGLDIAGGAEIGQVALPPLADDADIRAALLGPGSQDVPLDLTGGDQTAPELESWRVRTGSDFVAQMTDADGSMLSGWQQSGKGRIALWTVPNSFTLVLTGRSELYYQWWSDTVSAVTRPDRVFRPEFDPLAQASMLLTICGLESEVAIIAPDNTAIPLAVDPAAGERGCAAFWPSRPGTHTIVQTASGREDRFAIEILPAEALSGVRARELGEQTSIWAARQNSERAGEIPDRVGPAWPWFLGWLLVTGALWLLERRWLKRLLQMG